MTWTFGDLRTFFHEDEAPTSYRFHQLFEALMRAHTRDPDEVEEAWLPYALEMLRGWPDDKRCWDNGVYADDEATFLNGAHPVHALGRDLYVEEAPIEEIIAYCHAPDLQHLRSLEFYWSEGITAPKLEQALEGLRGANLEHLGLCYMKLDDACAEVLARAEHLSCLRSLNLIDHTMSSRGLLTLASAPHFADLRHLTLGSLAEGETHPNTTLQRQLMERMPALLTTLHPFEAVLPSDVKPSSRELPLPWEGRSARERVEAALATYRAANTDEAEFPFLGQDFQSYGGYAEFPQERFASADLRLADVFPRYQNLSQTDNFNITSIHTVALREGACDEAFDAGGALIAALELRPFAKLWLEAPRGEELESYQGACLLQTTFAQHGLCLDEGNDGVLRLTPEGFERDSALVRLWRAFHRSEPWVGGWLIHHLCTPWYEPLGVTITTGKMRAVVVWEEREHSFDARGELPEGQPMLIKGDGVALLRALEEEGFEHAPGRWEWSVVVRDTSEQKSTLS